MQKGIGVLVLETHTAGLMTCGVWGGTERRHRAAATYLGYAGEDNQAQSGAVESMLVWREHKNESHTGFYGGEDTARAKDRVRLPFVSCITMEAYLRNVMRRLLVCRLGSRGSSGLFITADRNQHQSTTEFYPDRVPKAGLKVGIQNSHLNRETPHFIQLRPTKRDVTLLLSERPPSPV